MRGLIVDEGRLNGLLVDEAAPPQLGELNLPKISPVGAVALGAVNLGAGYLLWKGGWKKLGGFLGFTGVTSMIWNLFGKD